MLVGAPAILFALTIHEYWHGMSAYLLGDDTAKQAGRLTLNPLAHLDPIGTIALFVIHIGWARPVPINPRRLRPWRWSEPIVSVAGPAANLVTAILSILLVQVIQFFYPRRTLYSIFMGGWQNLSPVAQFVSYLWGVLTISIFINLVLMLFNLIPIPPLDGSHIFAELLPQRLGIRYRRFFAEYGRVIMIVIILMFVFRVRLLNYILFPILFIPALVTGMATGYSFF